MGFKKKWTQKRYEKIDKLRFNEGSKVEKKASKKD